MKGVMMSNRKIEMYTYRDIIYRLQQGQSVRAIAQMGLAGRRKIREIQVIAQAQGWLMLSAQLPDDEALATFFASKGVIRQQIAKAEPYADAIKTWVEGGVQATVIHQHLVATYGFQGGYNSIQRFVKKFKEKQPANLTVPLVFKPGEAAQVDFGKGPRLHDERVGQEVDTWFFVMTLCWSRHQYVELVTHQDIETWLNCHQNAFNWFGGIVNKVIIDNPKCAITKACYYDPQVQRSYEAFAQGYGFIISACPPREPKKKGRVESGVKYVKRNFLPLKAFKNLQDANQQLKRWVTGTAGNRTHGSTFEKPLSRFNDIEQHQLKSLPTTSPEVAVWQKVSLYRDCHVRYLKCKYSAPYILYEKALWLKVTATTVSIYQAHKLVAIHPRLFIPGDCSTKQEHLPPNACFYLKRNEDWCIKQSEQIGQSCCFIVENLLTDPVRDLLRQAQLIIALGEQYGKSRLEKACKRAIAFNAYDYKTIKTILKEGIDYEKITLPESFDQLGAVYRGKALYQRNLNNRVH